MLRKKNLYFIVAGAVILCIFLALFLMYQHRRLSLSSLCPAVTDGNYHTTFYWGQETRSVIGLDDHYRDALGSAVLVPGKKTDSLPHLCFEFRITQAENSWILTVGADDSVTIAKVGNLDMRTYWTDPTGELFQQLYPVDKETGTGWIPGYRPDGNYDMISFSDFPYSDVNSIVIRNGHTGKTTYLNNSEDVDTICSFLSSVKGCIGQSSIGYYDTRHTLVLYRNESAAGAILSNEPPVLEITFGHDYFVYYGEYGDGYPIRYTLEGINCEDVFLFLMPYEVES